MLRILRSPPSNSGVAVDCRLDNRTNFIGADRSRHQGFRELFGQIRESLVLFLNHRGLHLSATDGGTTMPELARWVQVRDDVQGSTPSGLRSGPQVRWSRVSHRRPLVTVGVWSRAELVRAGQVSGRALPANKRSAEPRPLPNPRQGATM